MKVYIIEVTHYYGYPISRTVVFGVYSTIDLAQQALLNSGFVCNDGRWTYPCAGEPSDAVISEYAVDS